MDETHAPVLTRVTRVVGKARTGVERVVITTSPDRRPPTDADQTVDELHLSVATPGTDVQRPSGQGLIAIPIVEGRRGIIRPGLWRRAEQAVISQAVEAAREHMQRNTPDELRRGQRHGLLSRCAGPAVVGVAEPDLPASRSRSRWLEIAIRWV